MAKSKKKSKKPDDGRTTVAVNRRARRNFDILDTLEAGIVLRGSEVKSLREAQVQLADAYVRFADDEAWLQGVNIAPYLYSQTHTTHSTDRHRKLLMHRRQIDQWSSRVDQERLTVVPLSIYFLNGRAKVELGLARGRQIYDKRQVIAERDAQRDAAREMVHRNR